MAGDLSGDSFTDYTKPTGASGTMLIRDYGNTNDGYVEFWLKCGPRTYQPKLPWSYQANGYSTVTLYFNFQAGGDWQRLGRVKVADSQTVVYYLHDTDTAGLGGPTTFSKYIARAQLPHAPYFISFGAITSNSVAISFRDGEDNGGPIDSRQVGYGTSSSAPQKTVTATGTSTSWTGVATDLLPNTTYYFWGRNHNIKGWSNWTLIHQATTLSVVRIKVAGVWKTAVPYVKSGGVWKVARPWGRIAGVWKEAK